MTTLRLGSRGSALARWQAEHVRDRLLELHPGLDIEIRILHTTGDRITDVPLAMIGDKGLFTKEIDRAILDGAVDLAVHSLKDVPTELPAGLDLGAILEREDPRDLLLATDPGAAGLQRLPPGARIGTSSLRRRAQLLHARPDLRVEDLRGNLDTRLARLAERRFDAVILALAGVRRLGREADAPGEILDAPDWLPAAGQGALAVAIRAGDGVTRDLVAPLDHAPTRAAVTAERAFLRALEGGCQIPIGALARPDGGRLELHGFVANVDGSTLLRGSAAGTDSEPAAIGLRLAGELRARGADDILRSVRGIDPAGLPHASAP
jgi:hydroxymethylbilane synthase